VTILLHELVDARPERSHVDEDVLLAAYGWTETPPAPAQCTCGEWIEPATTRLIAAAVAAHNESPGHRAWRRRMGIG
jgi:hypothetical protein